MLIVACLLAAIARSPAVPAASTHTIVAAGDIACDTAPGAFDIDKLFNGCKMADTAALVNDVHPEAVLTLGDEQYPNGKLDQFLRSYQNSWGRFKAITHPAPGNHEYHDRDGAGYFAYFGNAAGEAGKGWYSYDIGTWHLVALNSNCESIGGCERGSPQEQWLRHDLAMHRAACVLAYWHQPRFSSGGHHSDATFTPFWEDLYAAHADLVLGGHDHDYERFAPQSPRGAGDPNGIVQFVAGTGGKNHWILHWRVEPNSVARVGGTFGILALELASDSYSWRFISLPNAVVDDRGSAQCHPKE